MKKALAAVLAALFAVLLFASCAKSNEPESGAIDPEEAFNKLLTEVDFKAPLEDRSSAAEFVFGSLPEGTEAKYFISSDGACEDALIMISCPDGEALSAAEAAVGSYLEQRKTEADRYHPEELPKLADPVIKKLGNTLIVCITDDADAARSILGS